MLQHLLSETHSQTASYFVTKTHSLSAPNILGVEPGGSGGSLHDFIIVLLHFSNVMRSFTVNIPVAVLDFLVQELLAIIQGAIAQLPLEECSLNSSRCYGDALRQISLNGQDIR